MISSQTDATHHRIARIKIKRDLGMCNQGETSSTELITILIVKAHFKGIVSCCRCVAAVQLLPKALSCSLLS